jgi:hypothetical protein
MGKILTKEQRDLCLSRMGVVTWQTRKTLAGAYIAKSEAMQQPSGNYQSYDLQLTDGQIVAKLYLERVNCSPSQENKIFTLLDNALAAVKLSRITSQTAASDVVSPENRDPASKLIVMGEALAQHLLNSQEPMEKLRLSNPHFTSGQKFIVTYHPLDLLTQPQLKRKAWEDLDGKDL